MESGTRDVERGTRIKEIARSVESRIRNRTRKAIKDASSKANEIVRKTNKRVIASHGQKSVRSNPFFYKASCFSHRFSLY